MNEDKNLKKKDKWLFKKWKNNKWFILSSRIQEAKFKDFKQSKNNISYNQVKKTKWNCKNCVKKFSQPKRFIPSSN